jgi:hypothetical protein
VWISKRRPLKNLPATWRAFQQHFQGVAIGNGSWKRMDLKTQSRPKPTNPFWNPRNRPVRKVHSNSSRCQLGHARIWGRMQSQHAMFCRFYLRWNALPPGPIGLSWLQARDYLKHNGLPAICCAFPIHTLALPAHTSCSHFPLTLPAHTSRSHLPLPAHTSCSHTSY